MRATMVFFWALMALWFWSAHLDAQGSAVAAPRSTWPSRVEGFGVTTAAARQHALKEAVRLVGEYLEQLQPPLVDWKPTEDYIDKNLRQGYGTAGPDVQIQNEAFKTWVLTLHTPDLAEFARLNRETILARQFHERHEVANEHLRIASRMFLVVLVALALVFCYHRLGSNRARGSDHVVGK